MTASPVLSDDRLFPPDPATRAVARRLYEQVRRLPIVSPHGHTDPGVVRRRRAVRRPASLLHRARPLRVPDAVQPGRAARGAGRAAPRRRPVEQPIARAIWRLFAEHWHLFRGTPSRAVAGPRVRRRVRHSTSGCTRRDRGSLLTTGSRSCLARPGVPTARAVRAVQHRGAGDHRSAARRARCTTRRIRESGWNGRVVTGLPPRSGRRSRARGLRGPRGPARRAHGRGRRRPGRATCAALATDGAPSSSAAARPPPTTATRPRRRPTCRRAECEALFAARSTGALRARRRRAVSAARC